MIKSFGRDVVLALRRMRRRPSFAALAVTTLSLAIAAIALPLTISRSALRQAVPLPDPQALVWLGETNGSRDNGTSFPALSRWRQTARSFSAISALSPQALAYSGVGSSEQVQAAEVSRQFFGGIAPPPSIGRAFSADEDRDDGLPVVVVSDGFWRTELAARTDILGLRLKLNGIGRTVVGVMPPGFDYPRGARLWVPALQDLRAYATADHSHIVPGIARLRPGTSIAAANAELQRIQIRSLPSASGAGSAYRPIARPLAEVNTRDIVPRLRILIAAGLAMLLLGCANVANMFLTISLERKGEMTLRRALGASRRDLLSLIAAEILVILGVGACVGFALATAFTTTVARRSGSALQAGVNASDILHTLGWLMFATLIATCALTLSHLRHVDRYRLGDALKGASAGRAGGRINRRVRSALVAVQVALTIVLLVGAGVLAKTYRKLESISLGIQPADVYVANIARPVVVFTPDERARVMSFMTELQARLASVPGVRNVALTSQTPMTGNDITSVAYGTSTSDSVAVGIDLVSEKYFRTLGIPVKAGRVFGPADGDTTVPVVVIDAQLAKRVFGHRKAIGQTIHLPTIAMDPLVIGVVSDVRQGGQTNPGLAQVYIPYRVLPVPWVTVLFQSSLPPGPVAASLAAIVHDIDPTQPVTSITALGDLLGHNLDHSQFYALLLAGFALSSILVTAIGLYGVLSLMVSQRTFEIGVRMALGAKQREVFSLIMREAALAVLVGIALGIGLIFVSIRIIAAVLYGMSPIDPEVLTLSVLAVAGVAMVASGIPALCGAGIAPATALRSE